MITTNNNQDAQKSPFGGFRGPNTAIILAGGLGTRLRSAVPDLPKCMAPVAARPFIAHVFDFCLAQGIEKFILSLGYKSQVIIDYLSAQYSGLTIDYVIEEEPLGTGGGIQLACKKSSDENILVVNGDTLFKINVAELSSFHFSHNADCTLSLKPMSHFDRYGAVELNNDFSINSFKEKQFLQKGNINGGVYILNKDAFLSKQLPEKFSFEKDYLEKYYTNGKIFGMVQDEYFIDIGIPEDYERANHELVKTSVSSHKIDFSAITSDYTLFLDRDGVINEEVVGDYIRTWNEFIFRPGSLEAITLLSPLFQRIVVVTNQRGVGKGLMTLDELHFINRQMVHEIEAAGGRIDKVYCCTSVDNKDINRKPNPGMALQAKADFPEIDLSKSVMVGNMPNDMLFGRNIGAKTIYLPTRATESPDPASVDAVYNTLLSFAKDLTAQP